MKYEKYKLECGHNGNIVWRSSDGEVMGVRGIRKYCDVCYRKSEKGIAPTVHIIRTPQKVEETANVCPNCKTELDEDGFCPKCGEWRVE